jgi:hypothetical protein
VKNVMARFFGADATERVFWVRMKPDADWMLAVVDPDGTVWPLIAEYHCGEARPVEATAEVRPPPTFRYSSGEGVA